MAFIDLTHTISLSTTPRTIYPGDPELRIAPHATISQDGYNVHVLNIGTHTGTHLDAPAHFVEGGKTIDEIPLSQLVGKALVVDLAWGETELGAREKIEWEDLEHAWLRQSRRSSTSTWSALGDRLDSGDYPMLLVNTGWSKPRYPAALEASERPSSDSSDFFHHPYFSSSVACRLLASKVHLFGCDTPNPDETPYDGVGGADGYIFHQLFLSGGQLIAENLANLDQLALEAEVNVGDWVVNIVPLKIEGVDGSPIRAFAYRKATVG